ncbi:hypothetical protein EYB33_14860 [Lysinibacillus sphaericus]|uniref:hypothetical protein n=1 Tax=Lysinibacillus TaxID=400634 RepID=UPI001CD9AFA8|nr:MULTISPECIES: hypothetical protein [Lysinibacillus]UDK97512.1 hypothetical protein EYB33_14860 [Lysinibacillus sphaericus]
MTNNNIHKKIIDMLETDNVQIKKFIEDVLIDSENGTVDEVIKKYQRNISNYVEVSHETKMD